MVLRWSGSNGCLNQVIFYDFHIEQIFISLFTLQTIINYAQRTIFFQKKRMTLFRIHEYWRYIDTSSTHHTNSSECLSLPQEITFYLGVAVQRLPYKRYISSQLNPLIQFYPVSLVPQICFSCSNYVKCFRTFISSRQNFVLNPQKTLFFCKVLCVTWDPKLLNCLIQRKGIIISPLDSKSGLN